MNREITADGHCIDRYPACYLHNLLGGRVLTVLRGSRQRAALKQGRSSSGRSGAVRMATVLGACGPGRFIKDLAACAERLPVGTGWRADRDPQRAAGVRSYVHVGTMMRLFWAMLVEPAGLGPAGDAACVRVAG